MNSPLLNAQIPISLDQPDGPDEEAVVIPPGGLPPVQGREGKFRVFVLDDHPLFRFGLKRLINAQPDMMICGEAQNAVEGLDEVLRVTPDLITVDISLNDSANGIEFVKNIRAHLQNCRILVLSMHDESIYALRALRAGAQGYLMKEEVLARVVEAVRTVAAGGIFLSDVLRQQVLVNLANGNSANRSPIDSLSDRELEVLQLTGQGLTPREIATQLGISVKTVETHRMRLREKLNLASSAELMRFAIAWNGERQGSA
ncbi:MAG TPA: response regulator transcription factor [Chthoniobacteraceae bacterium]|jgi:DNA-binding NarL/FixJ family response regulator|nr:response regulator transcription factor [Chthoniobacteraceae bacterium]